MKRLGQDRASPGSRPTSSRTCCRGSLAALIPRGCEPGGKGGGSQQGRCEATGHPLPMVRVPGALVPSAGTMTLRQVTSLLLAPWLCPWLLCRLALPAWLLALELLGTLRELLGTLRGWLLSFLQTSSLSGSPAPTAASTIWGSLTP